MDNYAWQVIQRERDKMADLVTAKKWLKNANTVIVTAEFQNKNNQRPNN